MYWIFAILLAIAILIPDIIRGDVNFLAEERAEELAIFVLGSIAFLTFIQNERRISVQKKEKENAQKKMNQAVKDLVDSYGYIGEVNRKMDILVGVALGLADNSIFDRKKEKEIYDSIISATNFLLKANSTIIRFINLKTGRIEKEIIPSETVNIDVRSKDLIEMQEDVNVKKEKDTLIISSSQKIKDVKSYLIITNYNESEESKPKNLEILKLFASQAIFLYSYTQKGKENEDIR